MFNTLTINNNVADEDIEISSTGIYEEDIDEVLAVGENKYHIPFRKTVSLYAENEIEWVVDSHIYNGQVIPQKTTTDIGVSYSAPEGDSGFTISKENGVIRISDVVNIGIIN